MKKLILVALLQLPVFVTAAQAIPFELASVKLQDISEQRVFYGRVEAINRATVTAQTSGRVTEILADIDDYVEQGQVILTLNATTQQAAVNGAKASLSEANALLQDTAQEENRISEIYRQGLVSKSIADKAKAALDAANARVKTAEAGLEKAEENLDYTRIKAPYAGIVMERHVEVGEVANPGQPLMTGLSLDNLRVVAWLPQSLAARVRSEQQVAVSAESGEVLPVSNLTLFPFADPNTHSVKLRVDVASNGMVLYPGMFVKLAVETGIHPGLIVPTAAIVQRREVSAVYVFGPGTKLRLRQVRLGREFADHTEVLSGLSAGEQVATDPISAGIYLKEVLSGGDL